jgi:mono/diheme cytochrome c family protein
MAFPARNKARFAFLLIAVSLILLGGWWTYRAWTSAERIKVGAAVYAQQCASCHGAKLEGQPNWQTPLPNGRMPAPPHNAEGHTWHHSDGEFFTLVKKGMAALVPGYQSDMPPFEGRLSDEEIDAVLRYIKSTWPTREREYQEQQTKNRPQSDAARAKSCGGPRIDQACSRAGTRYMGQMLSWFPQQSST